MHTPARARIHPVLGRANGPMLRTSIRCARERAWGNTPASEAAVALGRFACRRCSVPLAIVCLLGAGSGGATLHERSDLLHHRLARVTVVRQHDRHVATALEDVEIRADAREAAAVANNAVRRTNVEAVPV